MAMYGDSSSVQVDETSTTLRSSIAQGDHIEVATTSVAVWVNTRGGTASVRGANCIYVAAESTVEITVVDGTTLTAIRHDGTAANTDVNTSIVQ